MSTFVFIVIALAVAGGVTYLLMKKGKIQDLNNNNIPDVIEEKVAEVKETATNLKNDVKAKTKKAKEIVAEVAKVVKTDAKAKKPANKKKTTK
jgi:ABC-type lipoprotein release transport system permease subunit